MRRESIALASEWTDLFINGDKAAPAARLFYALFSVLCGSLMGIIAAILMGLWR